MKKRFIWLGIQKESIEKLVEILREDIKNKDLSIGESNLHVILFKMIGSKSYKKEETDLVYE